MPISSQQGNNLSNIQTANAALCQDQKTQANQKMEIWPKSTFFQTKHIDDW